MGRNRKWVLENDLSGAVWRTVLRGPRPPSAVWPRGSKRSSTVSTKGPVNQGLPQHQSRASKGFAKPAVSPPSVRLSPDERVAEARARVARLEAALQVLGETSPEAQALRRPENTAASNLEVHPKIAGLDREDPSRPHPSTVSVAAGFGEFGKVARRSGANASSAGTDGRRGPRGRGSEAEGAGCRIAARSSRQARSGRESGEGFVPDSFWSGRSAQCLR